MGLVSSAPNFSPGSPFGFLASIKSCSWSQGWTASVLDGQKIDTERKERGKRKGENQSTCMCISTNSHQAVALVCVG